MNKDPRGSSPSGTHEEDKRNQPRAGQPQAEDRLPGGDLESAYRAMAGDEQGEAEALEWIEATIGDVG